MMRVSRPALLLLAAAAVTGALGIDRSGHVHRGAPGEIDRFHRHAHLGAHRHADEAGPGSPAASGSRPHRHVHPHSHGGHEHGPPAEIPDPPDEAATDSATRTAAPHPVAPAPEPAPAEPEPAAPQHEGGYYQPPTAPPIPTAPPSIEPTSTAVAGLPALRAPTVDLASRHHPFRPRPPPA